MISPQLLRQPGQSLREKLAQHLDEFVPILMLLFAFWMVFVIEVVQKFLRQQPQPAIWLLVAFALTVYAGATVFRLRPKLRNLSGGAVKERKIAEILERLRPQGFVAIHDLPEAGLNIDHVVVGPSGVYAIETKYRGSSGTIDYRNGNDLIVGRINETPALRQARDAARAVRSQLKEHLRYQLGVRSLVVFMGDWQVQRGAGDFDVDVVAADRLESYFDRQQPELTQQEIAQISSHLERSARK